MTAVTFERGDKQFDLDIVNDSFTADHFGVMFQVEAKSVWLKELFGTKVYFPNNSGAFDFSSLDSRTCPLIEVMGRSLQPAPRPPQVTVNATTPGPSGSSHPQYSGFTSVVPTNCKSRRNSADGSFTIKIVQARLSPAKSASIGKPELRKTGQQTYVVVTERQAYVEYIRREVQSAFGDSPHTLVTSDGLEIRDSPGTRGGQFWKQPARKFFAIPEEDMTPASHGKKRPRSVSAGQAKEIFIDDEDDDDFQSVCIGKKGKHVMSTRRLEELGESLSDLHDKIDKFFTLSADSKIPLSLKKLLKESFSCKVCRESPMKPPIYFAKCCRTIVGCEKCVNHWYTGDDVTTKSCLYCGAERGYSETMRQHGLDEFLLGITTVMNADQEQP